METLSKNQLQPYIIMLSIFFIFTIFALIVQSPLEIIKGLMAINMTRGVLITDYIEVGGIGSALMNSVIISTITVALGISLNIVPTGMTLMAIFLTAGFSMFGKDLLNMIPLTFGVWLYSKAVKKPFSDFYTTALLAATLSPITSEIVFLDIYYLPVNLVLGVLLGTLTGFLFPMVAGFTSKILDGYTLYNMGFAGGLLATFYVAFLTSIGIEVESAFYISSGNNFILSVLLYSISVFLILCGLIFGDRRKLITDLLSVAKQSGKFPSDYYTEYGANIYVNMGLLCALGTTIVLILGAELNGPTIAGILTITGFGACGNHLRNVIPLLVGATAAAYINKWDPRYTTNVLTILFGTGLSPITGKYGVLCGILAGFVHVCFAHHLSYLSSGLNLYGNGFATGFVVLILIPIMEGVSKILSDKKYSQNYHAIKR